MKIVPLFLFFLLSVNSSPVNAQINSDTMQMVYRFMAAESYKEAEQLLAGYEIAHPRHPESGLWRAKLLFYQGERKAANNLFQSLLSDNPENGEIRLAYAGFLSDISKYDASMKQLDSLLALQPDNAEAILLKARLYFWERKYEDATLLLRNNEKLRNAKEGKDLLEDLRLSSAPNLVSQFGFSQDNQVISTGGIAFTYGKTKSNWVSPELFFAVNDYSGMSGLNKILATASNLFFFPNSMLYVKPKAGIYVNREFDVSSAVFIGGVAVKKLFTPYFTAELNIEKKPYLSNLYSIDEAITQLETHGILGMNYKDNWIVNAGYLRNGFYDNNAVHTIYIWGLKRLYKNKVMEIKGGYGFNYSNSDDSRFVYSGYNANREVTGVYNPYFTPLNQVIHSLLLSGIGKVSKRITASAKVSYGIYANAQIPYLYFMYNSAGKLELGSGTAPMQFNPMDIAVKVNLQQNTHISYDLGYDYTLNNFYTFHYLYFLAKIYFTHE